MRLLSKCLTKTIVLLTGVFTMELTMAASSIPKFGYVPLTFPRDILAVNQFAEHTVLGQILEPLVDADRFGNIAPGIADEWKISEDGKTLTFTIASDKKFSNGSKLTAKDVKYSLDRHLKSKSQSSNFLRGLKEVMISGSNKIEIHLEEPNVAIMKALTRDQLGIVPEGWVFDPASSEPFIGSGPYKMKKENGKWYLIQNDNYKKTLPAIKKWELVFFRNDSSDISLEILPDYIPLATPMVRSQVEKLNQENKEKFEIKEQLSFVQTSLWWYPFGNNFKSDETRLKIMEVMRDLVETKVKELNLQRATGIVPVGVAGYLPDQVSIKNLPKKDKKDQSKILKIHVAGIGHLFDPLFEGDTAKKIASKYGAEIKYSIFTAANLQELKLLKPDVIMGSWAGGFNDPEGFLPILNSLLSVDFVEYLADLAPIYKKARIEQNWTKRSELFREFNEKLVQGQKMIPGWKIPMFSMSRAGLKEEEIGFRYTPRLINVKNKE